MIWIIRVLDLNPNFLVEQEQVDIIEVGSMVSFVKSVVSATTNNYCFRNWQVTHGVIWSGTGGLTWSFNILELTRDNYVIDSFGLEIPNLVFNQLAVGSPSSEVIYSLFDFVTLNMSKEYQSYLSLDFLGETSFLFSHGASCSLIKVVRCLSSNQLDLNHLFGVKLVW
jgi:hypothetical protein